MGEPVRVDELVDGREDVLVAGDVGERCGAVFLDPNGRKLASKYICPIVLLTMANCPPPRRAGSRRCACPWLCQRRR